MANLVRIVVHAWLKNSIEHVSGIENVPAHGPYLLAPNHIDYLDGHYILTALYDRRPDTVHFLSQARTYQWTRFVHPVRWHDREYTIQDTVRMLKKGFVVCNFPEGKRNPTSTLLRGKTGTIRMALAAGVPIVPVGLRGPSGETFAESVKHSKDPRGRTVTFGAPWSPVVHSTKLDQQTLSDLTTQLMQRIAKVSGKHASA